LNFHLDGRLALVRRFRPVHRGHAIAHEVTRLDGGSRFDSGALALARPVAAQLAIDEVPVRSVPAGSTGGEPRFLLDGNEPAEAAGAKRSEASTIAGGDDCSPKRRTVGGNRAHDVAIRRAEADAASR
jgi:hypothetical protein